MAMLMLPSAQATDPALGKSDCRFALEEPRLVSKASWQGPCKDGLADGEGILVWHDKDDDEHRYEGGMLRGQRHGLAYVKNEDGDQFEGHYAAGKREGKGILLTAGGDEYEGSWMNGMRHGQGTAKFATGGSYQGQWSEDRFHGHGKATYIGGQVFEGEFVNGRKASSDTPPPAADEGQYVLYEKTSDPRHTLSKRELSQFKGLPFEASYQQLSPAQKQTARHNYPMLREEDEPPYPAKGLQSATSWMSRIQNMALTKGSLIIHAMVGSDGKASTVKIFKSPDPELSQAATLIMMEQQFKPGRCAGQPCPMVYQIHYRFTLEN
jgi:hypothetical protein